MTSRCPRTDCPGTSFEMKELKVLGAKFRQMAIQCSSCGAVVGTTDFVNVGALLENLANKLGVSVT